jgi:hypothetical protein
MFRSYLIDPLSRTVTKVREGFDRAEQLLGTDRLDVATLWTASFDPHSSVNLVSADEATLDQPINRCRKPASACFSHATARGKIGKCRQGGARRGRRYPDRHR